MKLRYRLVVGLLLGWGTAAVAQPATELSLPESLSFPEGIAYDPGSGHVYTASAANGTVARTDRQSGASEILVEPGVLFTPGDASFPAALGMKIDAAGRLWISGGRTGQAFILETATGQPVKSLATEGSGSLLNDLVLLPEAAYFTDTLRPVLWRVPITRGAIGELQPWLDLSASPITYGEGANLNGIAATPDGRALIVGQMNKGLLYRIDVASRSITPIPLEGGDINGADGLVLDGTRLYVVRQPHAEVVTIELSSDLASGRITNRFTDPALRWPATAVKAGSDLLVVNSQFNRRAEGDPQTPFTVTVIPLSALEGG